MAILTLSQLTPVTIIAATSTAGSAPSGGTDSYTTAADGGVIRTTFKYTATVTSCKVRMYVKNGGAWFRAASTDDGTALTGTDEARDWTVGEGQEFTLVVEAIAGGGTVAVSAVGVQG